MSKYVTNFVKVLPDKGSIEAYRIVGKVNLGMLAGVINRYAEGLVASFLPADYDELRAGIYVASIEGYLRKEDVKTKVENALEKYREKRAAEGFPIDDVLNINNITIEPAPNIPSTAYVVANLLNNFLNKVMPRKLRCPRRPGERLAICLDIDFLERGFWSQGIIDRDERFLDFCNDYPSLCRDTGGGCSKFFKVVKCITMRFQHVVSDREEIYLVLRHYYRRLSNLDLKLVIDYMKSNHIDLNNLLGVRVNHKVGKGSTWVCEIASINDGELMLKCEGEKIRIDISELDNTFIAVNPTYSQSRRFIGKCLCREFDRHKDLNRLYPSEYFSILENDIEIVRRIIGKPCIDGVCFSIDRRLKRVW